MCPLRYIQQRCKKQACSCPDLACLDQEPRDEGTSQGVWLVEPHVPHPGNVVSAQISPHHCLIFSTLMKDRSGSYPTSSRMWWQLGQDFWGHHWTSRAHTACPDLTQSTHSSHLRSRLHFQCLLKAEQKHNYNCVRGKYLHQQFYLALH